jgi:metal-responsive CopG/Arc/MetJ family transcriptional regulator
MTTSLRLPPELAAALDRLAAERRTTRSEVIRDALAHYLASARARGIEDRVGLLRRLVNYPGSNRGDLASRSEEYLRELFSARRRRRPR